MTVASWLCLVWGGFLVGMIAGKEFESRIWRGKGNHDYMNRMASGGHLYIVKREKS